MKIVQQKKIIKSNRNRIAWNCKNNACAYVMRRKVVAEQLAQSNRGHMLHIDIERTNERTCIAYVHQRSSLVFDFGYLNITRKRGRC
jgi:hypothetical protein